MCEFQFEIFKCVECLVKVSIIWIYHFNFCNSVVQGSCSHMPTHSVKIISDNWKHCHILKTTEISSKNNRCIPSFETRLYYRHTVSANVYLFFFRSDCGLILMTIDYCYFEVLSSRSITLESFPMTIARSK